MDDVDQQLIALLRANARESVATLAHRLKVSRGTVANRLQKLEDAGVIVGYTLRLRPDIKQDLITAWMSLTVDGNKTREVVARLLGEPTVSAVHDTNGRWDLLAELRAVNLQELSHALERIRLIKGIASSETSIHLQSFRMDSA